jgi:anti-sigma factor ChrR (cupin superfamily)
MSDTSQDPKDLAAAYALGALDAEERARFEASLAKDARLRAEVDGYRTVVAHLALAAAPMPVPADLREKVLGRVRALAATPDGQSTSRDPSMPYDALDWEPGGVPGLQLHWIRRDTGTGESVVLMRGEPGTRYPDHLHTGEEHGFVLQGAFADALGEYIAGDYLHYPAGSVHRDIRVSGRDVCYFLVITGPIVRLEPAGSTG